MKSYRSDETPPWALQHRHHMALRLVLHPETESAARNEAIARCHDFAVHKVPARSSAKRDLPKPMIRRFLTELWPATHAEEIKGLFQAYASAGLIDVEDLQLKPFDDYMDGTLSFRVAPLELAVRSYQNLDAMVALLECGADETKVPKSDYQIKGVGPVLAAAGDFLEFTRNQPERGLEFLAAAQAALMRRVITASVANSESESPAPAAQPRRKPSV